MVGIEYSLEKIPSFVCDSTALARTKGHRIPFGQVLGDRRRQKVFLEEGVRTLEVVRRKRFNIAAF